MKIPARRVPAGVAALFAILGCFASACSSADVAGRGTSVHPAASPRRSGSSGGGGAAHSSGPHGLLLLIDRTSGATVETIDPLTGAVTGRATFIAPSGVVPAGLTPGFSYGGFSIRSAFNSSLTQVAAQGPLQPDGSVAVGVLDGHGRFTVLTPPTRGYASPKVYAPAGFAPDGRLWYEQQLNGAPQGVFYSVDPAQGVRSTRRERLTATLRQAPQSGLSTSLFWVGAAGPYDADAVTQDDFLPLPANRFVSEAPDAHAAGCPDGSTRWGWHVGVGAASIETAPLIAATNGCLSPQPVPAWPVDRSSFLTTYGSGPTLDSATQIYDNAIVAGRVRATAVLPGSTRLVSDVVADPSGRNAAFISTAGSTRSLDVVPLSGGEPRPVLRLSGDPQADYTLFDWRR